MRSKLFLILREELTHWTKLNLIDLLADEISQGCKLKYKNVPALCHSTLSCVAVQLMWCLTPKKQQMYLNKWRITQRRQKKN